MLLTIHNLPSTTRYADVKSLLQEKCGLTDVIVDNLVNEGKNKRVTVGLASEDDGSFVVRKLNGLFINGDQLYIEDKRRTTADQPYRPGGFDANVMQGQGAMVPSTFASWNQTAPAVPYVALIDQNLAYSGYVGVPQMPQIPQYTLPQPVPAEMPGYTGYQGGGYPPNQGVRIQDPEDQRRSARDLSPANPRRDERKRRHSPERRPPPNKRTSRFDNHKAPSRREPTPPRRQRPQEEQRFRESEQFPRNQHSKPDARPRDNHDRRPEPQWEKSRWDDPNPRTEPEREWGNERRAWESQPNQPEPQWQEEPRQWDTPKPQWEAPSKQWDIQPKSQWDDQPKPQWDAQPKPRFDIPPKPQWETRPAHPAPPFEAPRPQWDAPPQPQWEDAQPEPQWDPPQNPQWNAQSEPQWERNSHIPVENIHSERYNQQASDRLPREDVRGFRPPERSRNRDSGRRDQGFNKPDSDPVWRKQPENSFSSRQGRPEETRRDRPRSKGRQGSDWRDEQPIHPRDRSDNRNKPYGRQNDFSEPKRQVRPEKREAPKVVPRFDKQGQNKGPNKPVAPNKFNAANKTFAKEKNTYPPVSLPQKKPFDSSFKKPQSLRFMINKDHSNRGQATALIAKTVFGVDSNGVEPTSYPHNPYDLESFTFKQLKLCIRSRVDVLLGEELSSDMAEVVKRYRKKFPITEDKTLMVQIREKSLREFEENEKQNKNEDAKDVEEYVPPVIDFTTGNKKQDDNNGNSNYVKQELKDNNDDNGGTANNGKVVESEKDSNSDRKETESDTHVRIKTEPVEETSETTVFNDLHGMTTIKKEPTDDNDAAPDTLWYFDPNGDTDQAEHSSISKQCKRQVGATSSLNQEPPKYHLSVFDGDKSESDTQVRIKMEPVEETSKTLVVNKVVNFNDLRGNTTIKKEPTDDNVAAPDTLWYFDPKGDTEEAERPSISAQSKRQVGATSSLNQEPPKYHLSVFDGDKSESDTQVRIKMEPVEETSKTLVVNEVANFNDLRGNTTIKKEPTDDNDAAPDTLWYFDPKGDTEEAERPSISAQSKRQVGATSSLNQEPPKYHQSVFGGDRFYEFAGDYYDPNRERYKYCTSNPNWKNKKPTKMSTPRTNTREYLACSITTLIMNLEFVREGAKPGFETYLFNEVKKRVLQRLSNIYGSRGQLGKKYGMKYGFNYKDPVLLKQVREDALKTYKPSPEEISQMSQDFKTSAVKMEVDKL